jgi:hypothetical protein
LPNTSGRSRQGAPARASQSTASINSRLSAPLRPGSPTLPGKCAAIRSQTASSSINRTDIQASAKESLNQIFRCAGIWRVM